MCQFWVITWYGFSDYVFQRRMQNFPGGGGGGKGPTLEIWVPTYNLAKIVAKHLHGNERNRTGGGEGGDAY